VRFQTGDAENHLGANRFQATRQPDVGLLIEARPQLNHGCHRLAGFGGFDESLHDGRVMGRSIQRLLDRDDLRVLRRLTQKLHDHVEAFERVVHDEVLGADRREAVAMKIAYAFGRAWCIGREQQVGHVVNDKLFHVDDALKAMLPVGLIGIRIDFIGHECLQVSRHVRIEAETDNHARRRCLSAVS
jgi:hypothetical protein